MATGGYGLKPDEYLYGQNPNVFTSLELDKLIAEKDAKVTGAQQAVFIQCVGSREPQRPYCSRLCCTHSVESAIELKRLKPDMDVFILYRDMRTTKRPGNWAWCLSAMIWTASPRWNRPPMANSR
jgi:heterodisulfide reductase subunit A